ncbi:hypothetical protein BofuT4_P148740.1 [Botrytis cinerea T4]|uniref:Uncharacterized protein n=1 Tax=Botryotinia fuckeliana (strain T4) TaxID=999810 RepID=G2YX26_BOTF4|nr:hypothetical protein BofuT4_P148740.1 [Botrytis cinerea T4]
MFGWFGALLCVLSLVFLRGFAYRLAGCTIFVSLGRLVRYTCFIGKKGLYQRDLRSAFRRAIERTLALGSFIIKLNNQNYHVSTLSLYHPNSA